MPRTASGGSADPGDAMRHLRRGGPIPSHRIGGYRTGTAYPHRAKRRGKRRSRR